MDSVEYVVDWDQLSMAKAVPSHLTDIQFADPSADIAGSGSSSMDSLPDEEAVEPVNSIFDEEYEAMLLVSPVIAPDDAEILRKGLDPLPGIDTGPFYLPYLSSPTSGELTTPGSSVLEDGDSDTILSSSPLTDYAGHEASPSDLDSGNKDESLIKDTRASPIDDSQPRIERESALTSANKVLGEIISSHQTQLIKSKTTPAPALEQHQSEQPDRQPDSATAIEDVPQNVEANDSPEYEIEKLISHRVDQLSSTVDFHVLWKGGIKSWEPEQHLQRQTPDLILDYWASHGGRQMATGLEEFHVLQLLDYWHKPPLYLVQWVGYGDDSADTSWEPIDKLRRIAPRQLTEFQAHRISKRPVKHGRHSARLASGKRRGRKQGRRRLNST